jgi:amino acid adenylation domain-containing protein
MATLDTKTLAPVVEDPSERASRHREWQAGGITKIFEQQAVLHPNRVAVSCGAATLTYAELNARSNQLARCLKAAGVGQGTRVGLFLDRSLNTLISILAVLKTGAAYVPMDPAYPWERLKFIMDDAGVPVIITERSVASKLQDVRQIVFNLDEWRETLQREDCEDLGISISPKSPAYVIYTSGSTGKPKGVLVSHYNVVRLFNSTEQWFGFNAEDVWTLFHSYGFDFSVWEIWGALFYGGRVVVVPYWVSRTPETFYQLLSAEKVTVLNQTPSAFRQLIQTEENAREVLPLSLRYVVFGGEALELPALRPWIERHGDSQPQLINMYGITETTVHVTYRRITRDDVEHGRGSPIGVPIPDLQVHLLDAQMQPVPVGVEGEIYVGGEGVAIGYLNRPDLTAERFIPNPFCPHPTQRLYKSGDCARRLANGELEYLGRNDDQVKIHGFRVETGDIEAAINKHASVADSKVILRKGADGDNQLIAYVMWRNEDASFTTLREFLTDKIPAYMVPAKFVALETFPLTTNGKLDRAALPAPNRTRPELAEGYVAPRNVDERALADIWQNVLNVEPVGVYDNFFELGGDSIRSIQILARAGKAGLRFTAADLFRAPTIAELLRIKHNDTAANAEVQLSSADSKVLPAEVEDAYPMSQLQIGMVYHGRLDPTSAVYHDVFSYRIEGPFDAAKLNAAIQQLAKRHPILRTSFELSRFSKPMQLVHRYVEIPFALEDIQHLSSEQQDAAIQEWIEDEKRAPFDFSTAPLVRWKAHVRGANLFQLSYSSHHAILDGWSLAAMLTEVIDSYSALLNMREPVAAPAVTYKRFIALEQQALRSEESKKFWSRQVEEFQPTTLPRFEKENDALPGEVRVHKVPLAHELSEKLHALAATESLPLKCILLAAHLKVLAFVSGQSDVTTGFVMEGRPSEVDGEKILGLFLNTVPFRMKLGGDTWRGLAAKIFEQITAMMPHRRYPLAEIQRQVGGLSLFETAFDMVHFHVYEKVLRNRDVHFVEDKFFEATNFPFFAFFQVEPTTREISLRFDYHPAEISREQIDAYAGYYARTLQEIATSPDNRYESFSPLSVEGQQKLLEDSSGVEIVFGREHKSVLQHIEKVFTEQPNTAALRNNGRQLTYGELNVASNEIARTLRDKNSSQCVGIIAPRSLEAIISIIGVMRAGAAYVPIDPLQPRARIAQFLEQAKITTVVGTKILDGEVTGCDVVRVDRLLDNDLSRFAEPVACYNVEREDLAYVLFTSGSTGVPKGVQVTHWNLLNSTEARFEYYKKPVRSFLLASPHWFDSSVAGIFWTLAQGGELVVPSETEIKDPSALARLIQESRVSHLLCLPSVYSLLLSYTDRLSSLETVIVAGEECPRDLIVKHHEVVPSAELFNEYGPTEATVWCTVYKCEKDVPTIVPIGRPVANTSVLVVDNHLTPVPPGTVGEICVGGAGVARGYLNNQTLTEQKFVKTQVAGRIYKTGDIGRILPDGNIQFLGRRDAQVKIRGMRVELSEIETALRKHEFVENCVVLMQQTGWKDQKLIAYIQTDAQLTSDQLRDFLRTKLPAHMIPSAYSILKSLPTTSSGKIDRLALAPIADSGVHESRRYVAPATPFEIEIAKIWIDVLGIERIGVDWDFLESGGHSLTAMQVAARIMDRFQVDIPLAQFFHNATVAKQAALVLQTLAAKQNTISRGATTLAR